MSLNHLSAHFRRRPLLALAAFGWSVQARSQGAIHTLQIAGSRIELQFEHGFDTDVMVHALVAIRHAAGVVAAYLGRLPLERFEIVLQAVPGVGIKGGAAFAEPQPFLRIRVGQQTRRGDLDDDWILVHELLHLAIPQLGRPHRWLHEGIATYAEGAARVLAGANPATRWWAELVRGLPKGLPQAGDRGLDHTPTWGRTYWGGALFCLLADVRMRRDGQTGTGLRDALKGLLGAGGNYAQSWPVERVLTVADAAVGQTVLMQMYRLQREQPVSVDLDALWRELGVQRDGAGVQLLDNAPLAAVRRAIAN